MCDIPRTTCVVSLLLFATAIGHVLVSGESKSHIKNLLYSPACINQSQNLREFRDSLPQESTYYDLPSSIVSRIKNQVRLRDAKDILEVCHTNRQQKEERVNIAVFGGSMTAGSGCQQLDMINKACAWPARLQRMLDLAYPDCFHVHNFARGGTQTEVALSSIAITLRSILKSSAGQPALVLTDYSVNDAYEIGGNLGHTSSLQDMDFGLYDKGAALGEALVRTIRNISGPNLEHLMLLSHCPECVNDGGLLDGFAAASKFHSVPTLDFRQLFPKYWEPKVTHPDYRTHELMAELVADAMITQLNKHCSVTNLDQHEATFSDPQLLEKLPVCIEPISIYSAYDHSETAPLNSSYLGPWRLIQDREGKPGWITTKPNSTLTLPVGFGAVPVMIINYLKSYEGMGAATLTLNQNTVQLTGLWDKKMSTTVSFVSQAYTSTQQGPAGDDNHYGAIGFGVQPHTFHNLTLKFQPNSTPGEKFKLIEVFTC